MSILPYGEGSLFGWTSAYGVSVALHGAVAFGILGGFGGWLTPAPEPPESAPFLISFAPLESEPVQPMTLPEDPADPVAEVPEGIQPETVTAATPEAETLQPVDPPLRWRIGWHRGRPRGPSARRDRAGPRPGRLDRAHPRQPATRLPRRPPPA